MPQTVGVFLQFIIPDTTTKYSKIKTCPIWGAAIAQWIRLCLPICHPRYESKAPSVLLSIYIKLVSCGKDISMQKEAGIVLFVYKNLVLFPYWRFFSNWTFWLTKAAANIWCENLLFGKLIFLAQKTSNKFDKLTQA